MTKLLVEDTSLVSVADAIRTKGGTTNQLVFPDGFVSAIEGIQSGGENYLVGVVDGSITNITADMLAGCTKITEYAFYRHTKLKSIVIPEGVTSIETYAFYYCTGLTSMVIPEGVTSMGTSVFWYCTGLTSVVIPESLTSIPMSTFRNCSKLTSVVIPKGVTSIGNYAFDGCSSLATVEMKRVTPPTISTKTFNTSALKQIIVPAGTLSAYQSATNWSAYADKMVEASS